MIKLTEVHKKYNEGTVNEVYALDDINLEVSEGEFITIIGTNGSGKTTLFNIIAGTEFPDCGRIFLNGKDVTNKADYKRAKNVARVFQNPFTGTAPEMSISENLLIAYFRGKKHLPKISSSLLKTFIKEHIESLEMKLETRLESQISTLSGGQRQALTLLMAVINKPRILLLDEHTAALDPKSGLHVLKLTRKFISEGNYTTIMITHCMNHALELGTRTLMLDRGKIIEDICLEEKQKLTVEDLNHRFSEIRNNEDPATEMMDNLLG